MEADRDNVAHIELDWPRMRSNSLQAATSSQTPWASSLLVEHRSDATSASHALTPQKQRHIRSGAKVVAKRPNALTNGPDLDCLTTERRFRLHIADAPYPIATSSTARQCDETLPNERPQPQPKAVARSTREPRLVRV